MRPFFLSMVRPIPYPPAAPTTPPITAPAPLFFLLITAPPAAPATPPITAPFAALLQPFFFAVVEPVPEDPEDEEPEEDLETPEDDFLALLTG